MILSAIRQSFPTETLWPHCWTSGFRGTQFEKRWFR